MGAKFRQPPNSVAEATIISKSITANGTYNASSDSADGYNPVVVDVPGEHATIVSKSITANGTYNASSDNADGYDPVVVAVPEPVIKSKSITANGTYNASSDNADGFDPVVVNVPGSTIVSKSITANGTYNASSDNADGYNPITVNVPSVQYASGSGNINTKIITGFRPRRIVLWLQYSIINSLLIYDTDFDNNTNYVAYLTSTRISDPSGITYFTLADDGFTFTNTECTSPFYYMAVG